MLTHFFNSINWVDVGLVSLLVWVIFAGVQAGFLAELFKCLGTLTALFVGLHFYSFWASILVKHVSISLAFAELLVLIVICVLIIVLFKFLKDGILILFSVETNHEGFDKYAAGILAVGRGILFCSLTIVILLLVQNPSLTRMAGQSTSYKLFGNSATGTYSFIYHNLVAKFLMDAHYNQSSAVLVQGAGQNKLKVQ